MTGHRILAGALGLLLAGCATTPPEASGLAGLPQVGTVDERFQSYNVEMVEVTGGRFWAPYGGPPGEMYRMRPPTNLADPRLVAMARLLGPAYVRISGTWANSTYLPAEGETVTAPPAGFNQVLSRDQWRGVVGFAKAVDAQIVVSFPGSAGARNTDGSWNPEQAQRLIDLTRAAGGEIHSAELFNEPTIPPHGAFPKGYSVADFARDFRLFKAWAAKAAPGMKLAGPGGTAEGTMMKHTPQSEAMGFLQSGDLMAANPGSLDIVTYHYYGSVSQRCGSPPSLKDQALSADWLDRTLIDAEFYGALRDKHEPGKPLWLNETAQAACGGSPWAQTFLDSFRYVNQLGALARAGVQVVMHNTLAASDYGLIDQDTLKPRPNFWAAALWRKTMGARVLAAPASPSPDLRLFAHCLPEGRGGVGLVAINTGAAVQSVSIGATGQAWTLTGEPIDTREARVNGVVPGFDAKGQPTGLEGVPVKGALSVPAKAIAFLSVPGAANPACR
jgi:heparanase